MPPTNTLSLIDLIVIVLVILSVAGSLRRGGGVLSAAGAALATLLVAWLATAALAAWAPAPLARAAESTRLLHAVPAPVTALDQAGHLAGHVRDGLGGRPAVDAGTQPVPPRP